MWCIGQNYRQHAAEVGFAVPEFPVVFAKGVNSVQRPGGPICLPADGYSREVDYEGELVVVIGRACKNATRDRALEYVAGYTCGNDVSDEVLRPNTEGSGREIVVTRLAGTSWDGGC